jgi:hypothetical protein
MEINVITYRKPWLLRLEFYNILTDLQGKRVRDFFRYFARTHIKEFHTEKKNH